MLRVVFLTFLAKQVSGATPLSYDVKGFPQEPESSTNPKTEEDQHAPLASAVQHPSAGSGPNTAVGSFDWNINRHALGEDYGPTFGDDVVKAFADQNPAGIPCELPVEDYRNLTREKIEKYIFHGAGQGFMIRNVPSPLKKGQLWTHSEFLRKYGQYHVMANDPETAEIRRVPFQETVNGRMDRLDTKYVPRYFMHLRGQQSSGPVAAALHKNDLRSTKDPEGPKKLYDNIADAPLLSIGGKGSWNRIHLHTPAFQMGVEGRKLWWVGSSRNITEDEQPEVVLMSKGFERSEHWGQNVCTYSSPAKRAGSGSFMKACVVGPGDAIVVPNWWYHGTCNLDPWVTAYGAQTFITDDYQSLLWGDLALFKQVIQERLDAYNDPSAESDVGWSEMEDGTRVKMSHANETWDGDHPPLSWSRTINAELQPEYQDKTAGTILHSTAKHGHQDLTEFIIEKWGEKIITERDSNNVRAVDFAASNGHNELMFWLLDREYRNNDGIKPITEDEKHDLTCLFQSAASAYRMDTRMLHQLIERFGRQYLEELCGGLPIFSYVGHFLGATGLYDLLGRPKLLPDHIANLLEQVGANEDVHIIRFWLDRAKETLDDRYYKIATSKGLCKAAAEGYNDKVQLFLSYGATSKSSVHHAVWSGKLSTVKILVDAGEDIFSKNKRKQTPLDVAKSMLVGKLRHQIVCPTKTRFSQTDVCHPSRVALPKRIIAYLQPLMQQKNLQEESPAIITV